MADEIVDATPETPAEPTGNEIQQPDENGTGEITQPGAETPVTPDYESLFADPKPEEVAPVDPNAPPVAPEIPKEYQEALNISEFVKEPAQVAQAVRAADEVWGVESGKIPAHQMLEGLRSRNPEAFSKIVQDNLIPYLEQITGKKLMDPSAAPAAEKTPEQQRIDQIEQRFQQQEQERQNFAIRQQVQQANGILLQKADDALKGTFLEGKAKEYLAQLAPHMGMTDEQATKAILAGDPQGAVAKAVKAMVGQQEAVGRAYAQWKIKESKTLKAALPAGKGNPRPLVKGELPEDATMAEKISYLNAQ